MTEATQPLLPVTPEDRDAAADLAVWLTAAEKEWDNRAPWFDASFPGEARKGTWDQHEFVQAFARHRISHSLPGDVGTVRIDNLAARKAVNCVLAPLLAPYISDMSELIEVGNQACTEILAALTPSALSGDAGEGELAADVRRLVIAARDIAFNDWDGDSEEWAVARKELDDASEAFALRVPWENEPAALPSHQGAGK